MAKLSKLQKIERERKLAKIARVEADMDRWMTRMTRAVNTFTKLAKQHRRMKAQLAKPVEVPAPLA